MRIQPERLTLTVVIGSCLMHVFCCGIPLAVSLLNLATLGGIAGATAIHSGWFEQFEIAALVLSGILLALTGALQYISQRINCRKQGLCRHEPCDEKKNYSLIIFKVSVVLFAFNLLFFVLAH